jgi:hypothetical protein
MCEIEPQSKSLTISMLEGMEEKGREGGRLKYLLPSSFLHSVVRMLDFPIKVSGQNNGGGYCTQRLKVITAHKTTSYRKFFSKFLTNTFFKIFQSAQVS